MTHPIRAATGISAVTLCSRILGLVRDVMMFGLFNYSWALGAFVLAWMIPNMLRRLFGEGALAASFIPAYARAQQNAGPEAARRLLAGVAGLLLLALTAATAVVVTTACLLPGEWVGRAGDGADAATHGALLLELTVILFPYAIPICLAAMLTGALNAHGTFALPAAAPIVLNLFWIAGLAYAQITGITDPAAIVRLIAWLLLIGGLAQLALSLVPMWRRGLLARPTIPGPDDPARGVLRAMGPTLIGMSLVQINSVLDQLLASYLVGTGAPSFIFQANRLLLFPHALTSLALATAIFPRLAALGAQNDRTGLRTTTDRASLHTLIVSLPAAVGMMLIASPLIYAMFAGTRVTDDNMAIATTTTVCLVASLPAIGIAQLHARALYALGDYRTPAWMALVLLVVNVVLDLVLVLGFGLGVPAFAIATSVASLCNAVVLRLRLRAMCPETEAKKLKIWPTLLATAGMTLAVLGLAAAVDAHGRWQVALWDLALPIAGGMVTYAGLLWICGQRQVRMR